MEGLQSTKSDWLHKAEGNELGEIILRHCQTENKQVSRLVSFGLLQQGENSRSEYQGGFALIFMFTCGFSGIREW